MPGPLSLKRSGDFARVMRQGRVHADRFLSLRTAPNQLEISRVGYSLSKRIGKAVVRNLIRRRLRALVRQMGPKGGWDVVVSGRTASATASFRELKASLEDLSFRAGLLGSSLEERKSHKA